MKNIRNDQSSSNLSLQHIEVYFLIRTYNILDSQEIQHSKD